MPSADYKHLVIEKINIISEKHICSQGSIVSLCMLAESIWQGLWTLSILSILVKYVHVAKGKVAIFISVQFFNLLG